ncbi:hypothetical protein ANN_23182 [Periplaneta americana]|uniref:DUF4817 domain-containing protein n=1 Tax=Periplaneta americana TaxID=6978 RepID=A0ABQ8SKE9_PERAM|nr:hypothetical protein ANN_23182 [Periplaneta americana]
MNELFGARLTNGNRITLIVKNLRGFITIRIENIRNPTLKKNWTDVMLKLFSTFCVNVKMQYTLNQRLFLVKQYWITNSITATQRAYQIEFGVRNPPKRNTILGLVNKLEITGSLVSEKGKHRSSRVPTVVVDDSKSPVEGFMPVRVTCISWELNFSPLPCAQFVFDRSPPGISSYRNASIRIIVLTWNAHSVVNLQNTVQIPE